jgi:hypothetical protein
VVIVHSMATWFGIGVSSYWPPVFCFRSRDVDQQISTIQSGSTGRELFTNGMPLVSPGFSRRWILHAS